MQSYTQSGYAAGGTYAGSATSGTIYTGATYAGATYSGATYSAAPAAATTYAGVAGGGVYSGAAAGTTYTYASAPASSAMSYGMAPNPGLTPPAGLLSGMKAGPSVPAAPNAMNAMNAMGGPFKFFANPPAQEGGNSPVTVVDPGTPFGNAAAPQGFMPTESIPAVDYLSMPTAGALGGLSPTGSVQMSRASPTGSTAIYAEAGSLPATTQNLEAPGSYAMPTEQAMPTGSYGVGTVPATYMAPGTGSSLNPLVASQALPTEYALSEVPMTAESIGVIPDTVEQGLEALPQPVFTKEPRVPPATAPGGLTLPPAAAPPRPVLQVGNRCAIAGLDGLTGAANINGQICVLISNDVAKDKWVVQMPDGNKARVPSMALKPVDSRQSMPDHQS